MFRIMLQKLWHKKWMNFCLLLGCMLMIATVISFPLYRTAAYDRMLQDEFRNYITEEGKWPTMNYFQIVSKKEAGGVSIQRMEDLMENVGQQLGVTPRETILYYSIARAQAHSTMNRKDAEDISLHIAMMTGLEDRVTMLSGEMYSETGLTSDGAIEVVVSQAGMVNMQLLVGETICLNDLRTTDGKEIRLFIKGVFEAEDSSDFYWQIKPDSMTGSCLMSPELFHEMFTGDNAAKYTTTCNYYWQFEYSDIKADQVPALLEASTYLKEESPYRNTVSNPRYIPILEDYLEKQGRIQATLVILQIPVLIMLAAFLFMISGQMYDMERNEISVIKSRGSSGAQIFRLYLYQSLFLTLTGAVLGIPLGAMFSRILGSARNFLEFDLGSSLNITFTKEVWIYMAAAMCVTLLTMTLPAIPHSRVTIVKLKQSKAVKKKSFWEKIFLDVILLGVSLYGYYSFRKNSANLAESVLMGEALDPLLYLSSSLFIMGMGLLFLRLQPYIVSLIYLCGKKFWKPASYASFMENRKNGRKQQFIMLFLIMTISLGMYHATVARTILQNAQDNAKYLIGADIILKEVWTELGDENGVSTGVYAEPGYSKYASMDFAEKYTKVLVDTGGYITGAKNSRTTVTIMGIHTKDFGSITDMNRDLTEKHYHEYLNELAQKSDGILVSENFHTKQGYEIGDSITYHNNRGAYATGTIVDFVPYFPGYSATVTGLHPDGTSYTAEQYLVVTHYELLHQKWGVQPYEIWIDLKEDCNSDRMYDWIKDNNLHLSKYVDRSANLKSAIEDPLLQGTNGVLTMGFMVTILLCAVGYLIYWIMSIRSREMIFGVLRACGMHRGELFHMLMNEQIFSGVFSVFAGIGIGKLASEMFVPMVQQAYAAANQVLPMKLVVNAADMMRLYGVIAGVMICCLAVLITLLFKMNVAKALKLGEE